MVLDLCSERKTLKLVVFVMIGIGLLEAAYGLIQALVPSLGVLWVDYIQDYLGTARGTFINRNSFAAFVGMIWPLALGITLSMTGRGYSLKEVLGTDSLNRQALMALGIIVFLLALSLHARVSFFYFSAFVPLITLLEALPISIFGIGVRDMGYVFFFARIDLMSQAQAASLALLFFATTVGYSLFGGILYLARVIAAPPAETAAPDQGAQQ